MNAFTISFVLGFTALTFLCTALRKRIYWLLGGSLIFSQLICVYDIIIRDFSQIIWLCNVAVFLNIFLLFKFVQRVFDLYFCFTWLGCFMICLMPVNPYSMMIKDLPLVWVAYWIKHIVPIVMSIYFIRVERRKLSAWFIYTGVVGFLSYCFVTYFYNLGLDKNVLYLNHPAPFMEALGPYYFFIAIPLGYYWLAILQVIGILCNAVQKPSDRYKETQEVFSASSQSSEGS